jgi:hypothetical protein
VCKTVAYAPVLQIGTTIVIPGSTASPSVADHRVQLNPRKSAQFTVPKNAMTTLVFVNVSLQNAASYAIRSGHFSQQGEIPPQGAAAVPPRTYDQPIVVFNVTNPDHPAIIDVSVTSNRS